MKLVSGNLQEFLKFAIQKSKNGWYDRGSYQPFLLSTREKEVGVCNTSLFNCLRILALLRALSLSYFPDMKKMYANLQDLVKVWREAVEVLHKAAFLMIMYGNTK